MPITDFEKYKSMTSDNKNLKADLKPLNFDALLKAGAFRVTHQGLEGENYNPDPMAGFSLVSAYNDAVGGNAGTNKWKDNPLALPVVKQLFTERPGDIGAHKYMQIVQSAKDLGLTDNDIYLLQNQQNSGVKMPEGYSSGGWTLI
jgi:hypothetical protein